MTTSGTVLWYVHHHGSGHWRRALAVASRLRAPVTFASSAAPPWPLPPNATFVELPLDTPADSGTTSPSQWFHWAPRQHSGLLRRHRILLDAARRARVAVVDVSVEVTVLLGVSGVPVIGVRLPGDRSDPPHLLAHDVATACVMPVPGTWGMTDGTRALGLVTPIDRESSPRDTSGPVVVVAGAGGGGLGAAALEDLRSATSRRVVHATGSADIVPLLRSASLVVGSAGLGTVADVAAVGRPFVSIPSDRPFDEQRCTARALAAREACVSSSEPSGVSAWRTLIAAALEAGPLRADVAGADRFAALVDAA